MASSSLYNMGSDFSKGNFYFSKMNKGAADFVAGKNGIVESKGNGQHVLSRHIGKTDAELLKRISSNSKITASSTFADETVANSVINSALMDSKNVNKINAWLKNGAKGNLPISYNGNTIIGRGVSQGSNAVNNLKNAKVILKGNGNGGFDVLTAYPSK
ncbi:RNase A-like domain-containing protein [Clostridium felsineum]|uniref:Uncharacterized protein n=1 Tax=Clostridium felsineum TaxID=36839 RepID=A0A1S8MER1_9CLOT|nr:RNase A-like domain-containing protein [Clostridium felsineum]URZ07501.1 hypothetical protein CLROS_028390 [Clostridium felsineum]URZ12532.1 hypothetical protein CROST_032540 [Clostridium felsineum]